MTGAPPRAFIVHGPDDEDEAGRVAEAASARGIATKVQRFDERPCWYDPECRRSLTDADVVAVIWSREKSDQIDMLKHAGKALEDGRLVILRTAVHDVPLAFSDLLHIRRGFTSTSPANVIADTIEQRRQRTPPVTEWFRTVLSPLANPTSLWWKQRHWYRIQSHAREAIDAFESSDPLEPAIKKDVADRFVEAVQDVEAYRLWVRRVESVTETLAAVQLVIVLFAAPTLGAKILTLADPLPWLIVAYVVGVLGTLAIAAGPSVLLEKVNLGYELHDNLRRLTEVWLIVSLIVAALIAMQEWSAVQVTWRSALAGGVLVTVLATGFVIVVGFVAVFIKRVLQKRERYRLTEAALITRLQSVLALTAGFTAKPPDMNARRKLMIQLEELADTAERGLPRQLRTANYATDAWTASTARRIAEGFRSLKTLAALPVRPLADEPENLWFSTRQESWNQMHESLKKSYVSVLRRDWAALPQAEPPAITPPQRFARAMRVLIALFTAAVPAVLLWINPPGLPSWTVYGILLWAVLSILWSIDPDVDEKLSFFERVVSVLVPSARKND